MYLSFIHTHRSFYLYFYNASILFPCMPPFLLLNILTLFYTCLYAGVESESKSESHSVASDSLRHLGLYSPWNSPGQDTGVGSRSLLQGIFPTQGSNPHLPHCRWILYQLSHQGTKREIAKHLFTHTHRHTDTHVIKILRQMLATIPANTTE